MLRRDIDRESVQAGVNEGGIGAVAGIKKGQEYLLSALEELTQQIKNGNFDETIEYGFLDVQDAIVVLRILSEIANDAAETLADGVSGSVPAYQNRPHGPTRVVSEAVSSVDPEKVSIGLIRQNLLGGQELASLVFVSVTRYFDKGNYVKAREGLKLLSDACDAISKSIEALPE